MSLNEATPAGSTVPIEILQKTCRPLGPKTWRMSSNTEGLELNGSTFADQGEELGFLLLESPTDPEVWRNSNVYFRSGYDPYGTVTKQAFGAAATDEERAAVLAYTLEHRELEPERSNELAKHLPTAVRMAWKMPRADPLAVARLSAASRSVLGWQLFGEVVVNEINNTPRVWPFAGEAALSLAVLLPDSGFSAQLKAFHDRGHYAHNQRRIVHRVNELMAELKLGDTNAFLELNKILRSPLAGARFIPPQQVSITLLRAASTVERRGFMQEQLGEKPAPSAAIEEATRFIEAQLNSLKTSGDIERLREYFLDADELKILLGQALYRRCASAPNEPQYTYYLEKARELLGDESATVKKIIRLRAT